MKSDLACHSIVVNIRGGEFEIPLEMVEELNSFFLITDEEFNMIAGSKEAGHLWHTAGLKNEVAYFSNLSEGQVKIIDVKINETEIRKFKIYAQRFMDNKGECYLIFSGTDVTDIMEQKDKLEETSRIKTDFLANLSHEIRNSLVGILGFCELMRREELGSMQKENVEIVHYCAKQLLGVVNNVLDLSKIESRQIQIKKEKFNLFNMIKQTVYSLEPQLKKKGLGFCLIIDEKMPDNVMGDEVRIRQILNNLLINAVKYTDTGYIKLEVIEKDKEIQFWVYDTGRGIDQEDAKRIFQPFVRIGTYGEEDIGSGLGLTITKELVEIMGGNIWYKPNREKGSVFVFSLPLEKADDMMIEESRNDYGWSQQVDISNNKKVLLVEDIAVNRKLVSYMLKNLGYEVITAENGQKCLEILHKHKPDVILMDMQMPVMNGYKAVSIIRETEGMKDIPVIALTAYAMEGDGEKCIAAGCDYYLSKPFTQEQLKNMLENIKY